MANILSDPYFIYRLQYCFQHDHHVCFDVTSKEHETLMSLLDEIKSELHNPVADSYHLIAADLFKFLIVLNRVYIEQFGLSQNIPVNVFAFKYKELLEKNIRSSSRVADYARMLGISRIALNKAVDDAFGVTAVHLLKQRLLQEIKNDLVYTTKTHWALNLRSMDHTRNSEPGEAYEDLKELLDGKNYYFVTTNQDALLYRLFPADRITRLQGDWRYFQCKNRCHDEIYENGKILDDCFRKSKSIHCPRNLFPAVRTAAARWWNGYAPVSSSREALSEGL